MSNPIVQADFDLTIPTRLGGDNKDTADQTSDWANRGFSPVDQQTYPALDDRNGPSELQPEVWYVSLDAVDLWCGKGAEILNYQGAYHWLADPNKICPYDPEGLQNWFEFGVVGDSHSPVEIPVGSANWYRSMLMGVQGIPLPCTEWFGYLSNPKTNETGIQQIISLDDFKQVQATA